MTGAMPAPARLASLRGRPRGSGPPSLRARCLGSGRLWLGLVVPLSACGVEATPAGPEEDATAVGEDAPPAPVDAGEDGPAPLLDTAGDPGAEDPADVSAPPAPYSLSLEVPAGPVRGPVSVEALPDPPGGTLQVELYISDELVETDLTPPYAVVLGPEDYPDGSHPVRALATRSDGATAGAEAEVILDNTPPSILLLSPEPDAGMPAPGEVLLHLQCKDPSGLGAAAAWLDDGPEVELSLDDLATSFALPPAAAFPVAHIVGWRVGDVLGNEKSGSTGVWHTHERLATVVPAWEGLDALPFAGGRFVVNTGADLRNFDAAGEWTWTAAAPPGSIFVELSRAEDGVIFAVSWSESAGSLGACRVEADGDLPWTAPEDPNQAFSAVVFDADLGVLAAARHHPAEPLGEGVVVDVGPDGEETPITSLGPGRTANRIALTPPGAPEQGIALVSAGGAGAADPKVEVLTREGEPLYDYDVPEGQYVVALLLPLPGRVVVALIDGVNGTVSVRGVGPEGEAFSLAPIGEKLTHGLALPAGHVLVRSEYDGYKGRIRRLAADGTLVYQKDMEASIVRWAPEGETLFLALAERVRRLAPDGGTEMEWKLPKASDPTASAVIGAMSPAGDGGFYALSTSLGAAGKHAVVWRVSSAGTLVWHESKAGEWVAGPMAAVPENGGVLSIRTSIDEPSGPEPPPSLTRLRAYVP